MAAPAARGNVAFSVLVCHRLVTQAVDDRYPTMMNQTSSADRGTASEPRVTIEMCGSNLVVRSTSSIDDGDVVAVADAVNAAALTNTVVVIDPAPVRCDDGFAASAVSTALRQHADAGDDAAIELAAVERGMLRIRTRHERRWIIDLRRGRFCEAAEHLDVRYLCPDAWTPVVAIMVTPRRLTALTLSGRQISSERALRALG
jgi:hypothetical protein